MDGREPKEKSGAEKGESTANSKRFLKTLRDALDASWTSKARTSEGLQDNHATQAD